MLMGTVDAASTHGAALPSPAPPAIQRPTCTRLLVQLDAVAEDGGGGGTGCSSADAIARLKRELASLRPAVDRHRRAKRLTRASSAGGVVNAHGNKLHAAVSGRATRALAEAVHEVDAVLDSLHAQSSPYSSSPSSPAFSPVTSPACLAPPSTSSSLASASCALEDCTVAAFSAVATESQDLARPQPRRSATPEKMMEDPSCGQTAAPTVGSPGRRSAFSSPCVAPRPPSKRRPNGDGSERRKVGRETILRALIESGVCATEGCDDTDQHLHPNPHQHQHQHQHQQMWKAMNSQHPSAGHPHKGLIRQLKTMLAQQRPDPSRILRLAERLLTTTITALAGAACDHNTGGGTLVMDILGVPELRERVLCNLSPRDLCRCRRVSRQLMIFGDEGLGRTSALDSADWGGITAFQLERRLPLCAPNLKAIRWDGLPQTSGLLGAAWPGTATVPTAVLTDDMLRVAARAAGSSLRELNLRGCSRLTECGLLAVAEYCGARLMTLELCGCIGLTDACLNLLSERCSSLRSVDLSDSALITDAAVGQLIARCPLTSLRLARCASITDDTVAYLVAASATDSRIDHPGSHCNPSLQRLDLRGCLGVTGESCELLASVRRAELGPAWTLSGNQLSLASTLHSVDLRGTNATDEEQRLLMQVLQQHQSF